MIVDWVVYPLVLAALGAGWGVLVERAAATRYNDALLIPLGLAAVVVVAGILTSFAATSPAAVWVCGAGALAGLIWGRPWSRLALWPMLAAIGVLLAYGAPVLLSGHATFLGYLRLDDTATWFNVVDNVMAHGHSAGGLPPSTYRLVYTGDVGPAYPLGAFMVLGVSHTLVGSDVAWVFQPYLAACGAAIALAIYALAEPFIASPWRRAIVAFVGAQPALLYGYSLWGGIKETTAAWLLMLGIALAAPLVWHRPARGRELLGVALAAGGLITTLSVGALAWIAPAFVLILAAWLWRERRLRRPPGAGWWSGPLRSSAWAVALTAVCALPMWLVLGSFLSNYSWLFSSGQNAATRLGNLIQPLSGWQLAGIWTVGDFRLRPALFPTAPLVALVIVVATAAVAVTVRRQKPGLLLLVACALVGCALPYLAGATPWVLGKSLAISSPALLTAALVGGAVLWVRWRAGAIVLVVLTLGVVWSNVLAYHDALLAPGERLGELAHIGSLVAGRGPTFVNDYEIYADRHFLRAGAPVEPAEYRPVALPLSDRVLLVKSGFADLDSFPLSTLLPYRSIVTRNSPAESRPPSLYRLVWGGRYYSLWQRPAAPPDQLLWHLPLGDQATYPYCGAAENAPTRNLCSVTPAAVPACSQVRLMARYAAAHHARLVAYQRPIPIVARGDQVLWPAAWYHDPSTHTLTPNVPGSAVAHIRLAFPERYRLWLGGRFARGFTVTVDGRYLGSVKDELFNIDGYAPVGDLRLGTGVHTVRITYPHANLTPGSGDNANTVLSEITFEPLQSPATGMLSVPPARAQTLCGRSLDWIEVTAPA